MLRLARQFHHHVTAVREYKRKIDREKLMIDGSSIVLLDEFFSHAVEPYLRGNGFGLAKLIKKNSVVIYSFAQKGSAIAKFPRYPIQYEQLSDEMKRYYHWAHDQREMLKNGNEDDVSWNVLLPLYRHLDNETIREMWREEIECHVMDKRPVEDRLYTGVTLDDLFQLANGADLEMYNDNVSFTYTPNRSYFNDAERWSVLMGDGGNVLRFWQDVSSLRDYSSFFPHKPRPKGNDRQKPQAFPVRGIQPAWGSGF